MIVVTGAAGFIGSHVAERLIAEGIRVVGIDSFVDNYPVAMKRANLAGLLEGRSFELVEGDIRDGALIDRILTGRPIEAIVHLAALAGVRPSVDDPRPYMDVNVGGTAVLLSKAAQHGVRRVVLASSSSVYGNASRVPFSEDDPCLAPVSPYGASKRAAELVAHTYHLLSQIDVAILRLFTVYGPRQRPEMAIHRFTRAIVGGEPITMFGQGDSRRDYTYVGDIVDGIVASLSAPSGVHVFNLGGSSPVSLTELIDSIGRACGCVGRIEKLSAQPGDVELTYADIDRARRILGFSPRVGLSEGLDRFVRWYRDTGGGRSPGRGAAL